MTLMGKTSNHSDFGTEGNEGQNDFAALIGLRSLGYLLFNPSVLSSDPLIPINVIRVISGQNSEGCGLAVISCDRQAIENCS
jgi:hypothetical protein